jgi:hypothetical protein
MTARSGPSLAIGWMTSAALLAATFSLALFTRADADLWGHLRYGSDIIETREIPLVDPYSFTQNKPWISHEWLSELQMALAYRAAGPTGLLVLKAAILRFVFAIVWRAWRDAATALRLGVMLALAMGTIHVTSSVRPQTWTLLCLALLCAALMSDRRIHRWWLPPVFTFWANCHGGWIVGFGVLVVWAAAEAWRVPAQRREWAALTAACALATLVHPSGIGLWQFLGTTVRMTREIDEWQPLWTTPPLNWLPWGMAVASVAWMWSRGAHRRLAIGTTLVMLAYAAARVQRIESLFITAAAIMLAPVFAKRFPRRSAGVAWTGPAAHTIVAAGLVGVLALSAVLAGRATSCLPIVAPWAPDTAAMTSLRHAGVGRIVTPFNWGQYALWHLGPRLRVSLDGRREAIYTDEHLRGHDEVMNGTPEGLAILAQWNPEYVWLPSTSAVTAEWLRTRGYRLDVETGRSIVLVRGDVPRLPRAEPAVADPPCFPG